MSSFAKRLAIHSAKFGKRLRRDLWGNCFAAASATLQPHIREPHEHVMLNDDWFPTDFLDWKLTVAFQLALRLKIG